jgi:hypothetical protein
MFMVYMFMLRLWAKFIILNKITLEYAGMKLVHHNPAP